jgi:hypothetical protein
MIEASIAVPFERRAGEKGARLVDCFENDDRGYLSWLKGNPSGFVLNISVSEKPRAVLHAVGCHHLKLTNSTHSYTTGAKACSDDRSELERWGANTGLAVAICKRCKL